MTAEAAQKDTRPAHPCFESGAFCTHGRIHLPVAPACNIQCRYCLRKFDCMNESRPGVTSRVMEPEEAARTAKAYLEAHPETTVVGFAGPGDPLANEATFETLALLRAYGVDAVFCLSTNGLKLAEQTGRLRELGVSYLTVTINAQSLAAAEQIYTHVEEDGRVLRGKEAAALLLERQKEGLRKAVESGFHVKVNMVLMDGINTEEVLPLAKALAEAGAERMNINSVINVTGDPEVIPLPAARVRELRRAAGRYLPQMQACGQCRADAAGIPGLQLRGHA